MSSETKVRQSHQELTSQLAQKDKDILELQAQLQKKNEQIQLQQEQQQQQLRQAQHTTLSRSLNRQTNFKVSSLFILWNSPLKSALFNFMNRIINAWSVS